MFELLAGGGAFEGEVARRSTDWTEREIKDYITPSWRVNRAGRNLSGVVMLCGLPIDVLGMLSARQSPNGR